MPGEVSVSHVIDHVLGQGPLPFRAAGERSIIGEETGELALPPAGAARAESVFTTVGLILLLALVVSTLWTLLRRRR